MVAASIPHKTPPASQGEARHRRQARNSRLHEAQKPKNGAPASNQPEIETIRIRGNRGEEGEDQTKAQSWGNSPDGRRAEAAPGNYGCRHSTWRRSSPARESRRRREEKRMNNDRQRGGIQPGAGESLSARPTERQGRIESDRTRPGNPIRWTGPSPEFGH